MQRKRPRKGVPNVRISKEEFLQDRQGKTFSDVANDKQQPFQKVLEFFQDPARQQRLEDAELHHDRPPLAGVVRELEAQPEIDRFLAGAQIRRNTRFRQAIGVLIRMIMEQRGWKKTGRKGSLGVRAPGVPGKPAHNTGGLAFWFIRAERYELADGMPYQSVKERCKKVATTAPRKRRRKPTTSRD